MKTITLILRSVNVKKGVSVIKITRRQVNLKIYKNMKRCSNQTVVREIQVRKEITQHYMQMRPGKFRKLENAGMSVQRREHTLP